MLAILTAQLQKLKRNPATILILTAMTVLFTMLLGVNMGEKVKVYTYCDSNVSEAQRAKWIALLNESDAWAFELTDEQTARNKVIDNEALFAVRLMEDDYRIIASIDNTDSIMLDAYIRSVYEKELMYQSVETQIPMTDVRERLKQLMEEPVLAVESVQFESDQSFKYDPRLQSLFGFSLFFSIYTVAYAVNALLFDRMNRIWDRVILSPVSKTSMYIGHLINSFLTGYVQILIVFLVFRYVFDFPLGEHFGSILALIAIYTFSIVALCMLMAAFVRTPQQMDVLTPIVSVSMAMIGGAYWPIEIVTNPVLIGLSKVVPVTYGMEALKGIAYHSYSLPDLMQPILYLCLIGVVCMGIGINMMERRAS